MTPSRIVVQPPPTSSQVWHLDSADFARPRATVLLLLRTPQVAGSAAAAVLTTLLTELLQDQLAAPLAPTADAGVGYAVQPHPGGLLVQVSGYSQHVPTLCLELARRLRDFRPEPERFAVVREQLERAMRNRRQVLIPPPHMVVCPLPSC